MFWFLAGIGIFASILFSPLSAVPYVGGDEVFLLTKLGAAWDHSPWVLGYWEALRSRYFLVHSLRFLHQLFGEDLRVTLFLFQMCFFAALGFLFLTLRRFFSLLASTMGVLLTLAFVGKYEIFLRFEGGFYHVVLLIFSLALWILSSSRWSYGLRMILVTGLLWIASHFYEILIATTPFFPLLFFLEARFEKRTWWTRDFAFSFLPLVGALAHIVVLSTAEVPIWVRDSGTAGLSVLGLIGHALKVFWGGLNSLLGGQFFQWSFSGAYSFLRVELLSKPMNGVLILAALSFFALLIRKNRETTQRISARTRAWLLWAAVLFFLTPMISLPVAKEFVPSRFTYLSSFALSFLAAGFLDQARFLKQTWNAVVLGGIILFQTIALAGLNAQHQWAGDLDRKIERGLKASGLRLSEGDAVFVSIPYDPAEKHYRKHSVVLGQYADKDWAETFWGEFTHLAKAPAYQAHVRREAWAWDKFLAYVRAWEARHPKQGIPHFVFLDDYYRPWKVFQAEFFRQGQTQWTYRSELKAQTSMIQREYREGDYLLRVTLSADE